VGILTIQNPDIPEGLERRFSVRIHIITAELPHSTELELRKLHQTETNSDAAFMLELLRGHPTSWEVLWPSEPYISLYSTRMNLGAL
jgi:hypothetical protein